MMLNSTSTRNRSPFSPTQWQELEHQALIFKYMVSGVPIPQELIYAVKRSLESSLASRLFPHQNIGWGCFQVGFGRKADPEPGRCRRTDGKKWRCSKEAYPDSKYCERHMHRGRNRSRKPVELTSTSTTTTATNTTITNPSPSINRNLSTTNSPSGSSYSFSPISSPLESEFHVNQNTSHGTILNPFLYPQSSTSRPPGSVLSHQNSTSLFLDSASSQADKDYRYFHGMREGVDERAFFPEASGSLRNFQDSYHQLTMNSYKDYSQNQQEDQNQHCFVLGTDFKSSTTRPIKLEKETETETQKPLHHFFGEWPPKNSDSWLDLASSSNTSRLHTDS